MERSPRAKALFEALRPEVLLTFGGMVVSKKIKQFLRQYTPDQHWHVDMHQAYDTYFCLKAHFKIDPQVFLEGIYAHATPSRAASYGPYWAEIRQRLERLRTEYVAKVPYSDFKVFHQIFDSVPHGVQIQLANSATVRYAQLFDLHASNPVYCNRGTSGIEGSTSTAVGAAWNYAGPTLLVSGDLSFLYDANGLWNNALRPDFKIIVVNNAGGGIFRILPGFAENETFQTFFETIHSQELEPICRRHGLSYQLAASGEELRQELEVFFSIQNGPALLEVRTPRELNNKILLDYFEYLTW
jgi:2-succinyl-5-enolpyruvyl-6-hydroxy-3-cyclohexene-1-carboxylate synthase